MVFKCDCNPVHHDLLGHVKDNMPKDSDFKHVWNFYKAIADHNRLMIICALAISDMCVNDLANLLDCSKSLISHQLKKLKAEKLVIDRKDGRIVFYSLCDIHVKEIVEKTFIHIRHSEYEG